eukprot:7613330-Pyramimonas_sp.AAC.1
MVRMAVFTASAALWELQSSPRFTPATIGRTAVFPHTTGTLIGSLADSAWPGSSGVPYSTAAAQHTSKLSVSAL